MKPIPDLGMSLRESEPGGGSAGLVAGRDGAITIEGMATGAARTGPAIPARGLYIEPGSADAGWARWRTCARLLFFGGHLLWKGGANFLWRDGEKLFIDQALMQHRAVERRPT